MKLLFSFIFLLFSSLSFHTHAQVLIKGSASEYDFNKFDWSSFTNKAQEYIDLKNEIVNEIGAGFIISRINLDKLDLIRIEQELELYKRGIKTGLSAEMIQAAEEAIALHWKNVNNIENQIKAHAGLVDVIPTVPMVGKTEEYYNGAWELHKGDHNIVFNMVEKKDEALYKVFEGNDEAYAGFIAPYVERYMQKMGETAKTYYDSLGGELDYEIVLKGPYNDLKTTFKSLNATNSFNVYLNSAEIYKCFTKNFKESVGANQQKLMGSIYDWYTNQALLGMNSTIEGYKTYGVETRPGAVTMQLFQFYDAPIEVKEKIGVFLRNDILNNPEFINTNNRWKLGARVNALISLNYLGVATSEEQELYKKAIEQGIIGIYKDNPHAFSRSELPLPK